MDLRDVRDQIIPRAYENALVLLGGYPIRETGDALEELSELFQGLAICYLLAEADSDKFRKNLTHSGNARRYFLRKSHEQGNVVDRHLALSRSEAFLDALAAADLDLARDIARLSAEVWNKNWEYEDDFCFYQFLHTVVRQPAPLPVADLVSLLTRFEQALEGGASTRLSVCQALVAKDNEEFARALQAFLEERATEIDRQRATVVDSRFLFWPRSFVSVEALALLKVAEIIGLEITEELPLCPAEARLATVPNRFPDVFADLDRVSAKPNPRD